MDERVLTERLITYDTSSVDGLRSAAGFVKGWLEAREIHVVDHPFGDLHALSAVVGAEDDSAPTRRPSSSTATSTSFPAAPSSSFPASTATGSTVAAPTT